MQVSVISDIHVKEEFCDGGNCLYQFLDKSKERGDTDIILLGDIFDFMVGDFPEYIEKFKRLFEKMEKTLSEGVTIHYLEGNHDFHLKKLFHKYFIEHSNFIFYSAPFVLSIDNTDYLFCHGDEIELNNMPHHAFRSFTKSRFAENVILNFLSFKFLNGFGNYLSEQSRRHGVRSISPKVIENIREKSRCSALFFAKKNNISKIICGHSHQKDYFEENKITYVNNGFATKEKTYIRIRENKITFEKLLGL